MVGATIGVVGSTSASSVGQPRVHRAHEPRALPRHVDVVGGRELRRRARCARARSDRTRCRAAPSRSRWIAKASAGAKPPLALTAHHVIEQRHRLVGQPHAGLGRVAATAATEARADRVVDTRSSGMPLRDAEPQARERRRLERARRLARHRPRRQRAIGNAARHRPDRVERERQRERAVGRHALLARLEADDAAERRRNAGRAAGVGADRDLAHAVGDRDRAARGRAARHARAVGRIAGRAEMRIDADAGEGELAHVGLGDDHGAGRAQPPHHRRVGRGRRRSSASIARAGARRLRPRRRTGP